MPDQKSETDRSSPNAQQQRTHRLKTTTNTSRGDSPARPCDEAGDPQNLVVRQDVVSRNEHQTRRQTKSRDRRDALLNRAEQLRPRVILAFQPSNFSLMARQAISATICSASFLLRPSPPSKRSSVKSTEALNSLAWSGPVLSIS